MLFFLVQVDILIQAAHLAVHQHPGVAGLAHMLKDILMLALAPVNNRRHHHKLSPGRQSQHLVHDLLHRLALNQTAALRTMRLANPGKEQAQIIVNFRNRAHGTAGIASRRLLVNRDRRAQALDIIHIRFVHLP